MSTKATIEFSDRRGKFYVYGWKNNPKRERMYGKKCRVMAHGKMASVLIEFEDGQKEITSRRALRKNK